MIHRNPTTPVPQSFPETEPGLLTLAEFLAMRNPEGKHHENSAYQSDLASLNAPRGAVIGKTRDRRGDIYVTSETGAPDDDLVFRDAETDAAVGVLRGGMLYRDRFRQPPPWYSTLRGAGSELVHLTISSEREVKYPAEYLASVPDRNRAEFPFVLQRVKIGKERLEVRAERDPRPDKRDTIAVLNRDGLIVARGDDEWGATLTRVAAEYRGQGLGRLVASIWYELNPSSESGGFTSAGRATAASVWEERVREFLSRGWYSALVREGRVTSARVEEIVSGLRRKPTESRLPVASPPDPEPNLRLYIDDDKISFVLYDKRFLDSSDEKYIHGYGFLRDIESRGSFFYRIEHDAEYRGLVSAIGLQLARDLGEPLYVADDPADLIEWETVPHAVYKDGYVSLSEDVLSLGPLAAQERRERRKVDPYGQRRDELVEIAEAKWS